jgi:hypothetical protein
VKPAAAAAGDSFVLRSFGCGVRGVRRFPGIWTLRDAEEALVDAANNDGVLPYVITTDVAPFAQLSSEERAVLLQMHGATTAKVMGGTAPGFAGELLSVVRAGGAAFGTYVKLWPSADPGLLGAAADAAALADAPELEVTHHGPSSAIVWARQEQIASPALRAAMAAGRLRLCGFAIHEDQAAAEAARLARSAASALGAGGCAALATACSARGSALFRRHRVDTESRAIGASFGEAFACATVHGELGAPPGQPGQQAQIQQFTTTVAALGG